MAAVTIVDRMICSLQLHSSSNGNSLEVNPLILTAVV